MVDFKSFVHICCNVYIRHFYLAYRRKGLGSEYHFDVFYRFGVIDLLKRLYDPSLGCDSTYEDWIPILNKIDAHLKAQPGYDPSKIYDFVVCKTKEDERLRRWASGMYVERDHHESRAMAAHYHCKTHHWNYWWSDARYKKSDIYKEICRRDCMIYRLSGDEIADIVYQFYRTGSYVLTPVQRKYMEQALKETYYSYD